MIESAVLEEPRGQRSDAAFVAEVDQVQAELAEICGLANATAGRLCEVMAGLLRSGGWNQAGVRSPEHYLMWKCAMSRSDAHRVVRVARRIGAYPQCAAAFAAGELSLEQAHIICSCAPPTWADGSTCRFAKVMTIPQLRTTLRKYNFTEPGSPKAHEQQEAGEATECERRRLSMSFTEAGSGRINAELPADEYALVRQGLLGCRDDLFHQRYGGGDDENLGGHDPSDVSWADALVEMANRSLAHGAAHHPHTERNKILWHHSIDPAGQPVLHAHQGPQVPEWMRHLLLCDATIAPVAHLDPARIIPAGGRDGTEADVALLAGLLGGTPVNQGRAKRIVPDRLRRLVEQRDGGCRVPGCDARHWLYMHQRPPTPPTALPALRAGPLGGRTGEPPTRGTSPGSAAPTTAPSTAASSSSPATPICHPGTPTASSSPTRTGEHSPAPPAPRHPPPHQTQPQATSASSQASGTTPSAKPSTTATSTSTAPHHPAERRSLCDVELSSGSCRA